MLWSEFQEATDYLSKVQQDYNKNMATKVSGPWAHLGCQEVPPTPESKHN